MKKIFLTSVLAVGFLNFAIAQDKTWTMEECMQYAVENSPKVKQQQYTYNTYKAERAQSIASFFPSVSTSVGASYRFGRSVDDDNNYTNTTNFSNNYEANTSVPLFYGGQLVNGWRLSKVNLKLGKSSIQKEKDDLAIRVMAAFADVIYYQHIVQYATEKLEESNRTLYETQRREELGLKGKADVAQIESQVAEDDYRLTNYSNSYSKSILTLKELMNFPYDEELPVDIQQIEHSYLPQIESVEDIYQQALEINPTALRSEYQTDVAKMRYLIEKGRLLPTISFNAAIYTSYYKDLKFDGPTPSFSSQFKDKRNEYIGFSLNFPLFNGLNKVTNVKRANNNLKIAREQQIEVQRQLQTAIEQAVLDREGYAKESIQMDKKVKADEYSYKVTLRKYEEGLMSPLELQTSANILIQSKATLIQKKLMYVLKVKEVDYYKGVPLVEEFSK